MNIVITNKLTPTYLSKLKRQNSIAAAAALLFVVCSLLWMIFQVGGTTVTGNFSNIIYPIADLAGAAWAFITVYRARYGPVRLGRHHQLAWLLIGIGLCSDGLGGACYAYLVYVGNVPTPSLADIGFTLFYPLVCAGLLCIPAVARFRKRIIFDALITTLCLLGISWFFAIGPAYLAQKNAAASLLANIFSLSYPFWDMLLIFSILILLRRHTEKILHPSLWLFAIAIVCITYADTIFAYLSNNYVSGTFSIDPFWFIGFLLIGLAALYQYSQLAHYSYHNKEVLLQSTSQFSQKPVNYSGTFQRKFVLLQSGLIYVPFTFLLVLTIYSEVSGKEVLSFFLIILTAIVGILVTLRYLIATYENETLLQQIQTAHQQLQELDQLKDQFMITASHELRTPLTAVQGYVELLVQFDNLLPPEQRKEFLLKAQRSCDELVVLLRNVMDASRLEIEAGIRATHLGRVSVKETIHSIIEMIEPQLAQEHREVHEDISTELTVQADPERLRQILRNISANALKYSPTGTPIAFSAHGVPENQPAVVISVTDKGQGVSKEEQAHIFDRFFRLERDLNSPIRGSGLGLYISRCLIEAMGGKIWIESTGVAGEGSTFYIQLPAASSIEINMK